MGGGVLETNNQLERFTKNKKSKKLIYTIIGILLIIGSITLFKTFAFYEEKREFNVLKGKVPEFSHEDIQLAFTINGEKGEVFPTSNSGYVANGVVCSNGARANWSHSLWALTNINSNGNKKIYCSVDFVLSQKINLYDQVNIGDYISYTPVLNNYEITSRSTGYTSSQTINPSELKLWQVIRKNVDGSIDLISYYVSSRSVIFYGKEGYKNYVGTLNRIANSYETPGITSGSRYMGYDGQTEFISELSTNLWSNMTDGENSPKGSERERQGGGDVLYENDYNLVNAACGKLSADDFNTHRSTSYWISSRIYTLNSMGKYFGGRFITDKGILSDGTIYSTGGYNTGDKSLSDRLRPIVTLKSGIQANLGDGSIGNPWKVN